MDKIIRCITSDGSIMASAIDSTVIVDTAQRIHHTTPAATAALGRLLTASSLMGAMLKQEKAVVTVRVKGDGDAGSIVATANSKGNCRGYLENPKCKTEYYDNGKINVSKAVGKDGVLQVLRDYGTGQPYNGMVRLVSGELAEDITAYYAISEQIPTVCALGVLLDKENGEVMLAGGMLIQLLPGADEKVAEKLEENVKKLEPVTTMLAKGIDTLEMCKLALDGFEMEVLDEMPVHYYCSCTRERVKFSLKSMSDDDIRSLILEKGHMEAVCGFCNKKYIIPKEELEEFIEQRNKEQSEKKSDNNEDDE